MGWYSNSYLPERYAREEEELRIDLIIDEIDQLQHENNNFTIVEENEPSIGGSRGVFPPGGSAH